MDWIFNKGPTTLKKYVSVFLGLFLILSSLIIYTPDAEAIGTLATTSIGNQASATYEDGSGNSYISTSNQVTTTVLPVSNLTLTPDGTEGAPGQTQASTPGNIVYFPYVLTNTGNFSDTFKIKTNIGATSDFNPVANTLEVYWDKNGNGFKEPGDTLVGQDTNGNGKVDVVAEQVAVIGPVAPDTSVALLLRYQIPTTVTTGSTLIDVIATSQTDSAKFDQLNYSKTNVINDAVIGIHKDVSNSTIDPLGTLVYTFTIQNTGNKTATNIILKDALPDFTNLKMTDATTPTVSDASGLGTFTFSSTAKPGPFAYTYTPADGGATGIDAAVTSVKYVLPSLSAGSSRTINFSVKVAGNTPNIDLINQASFDYTTVTNGTITDTPTNPVDTKVNTKVGVLINPAGGTGDPQAYGNTITQFTSPAVTITGTNAAVTDKVATNAKQPAATSVFFKNIITNKGNSTNNFDITLSNSLPTGWTATFYSLTDSTTGPNNNSLLRDISGNGTVDTGDLAAGASITIVTKIFIPANASDVTVTAAIQATSTVANGSAIGTSPGQTLTDTVRDEILGVLIPGVDLTNIIDGIATDTPATVTNSESKNGTTVSFPLNVANTGSSNDTYNLSAGLGAVGFSAQYFSVVSNTKVGTAALVGATSIDLVSAAGFTAGDTLIVNGQSLTVGSVSTNTVTFSSGQSLAFAAAANTTVVEPGSSPLTSVGPIAAGSSTNVVIVINVLPGTNAGDNNVTFTATSTNSGTADSVTDVVRIPSFRSFTLVANRNGSGPAGGVLTYGHTLTNTGNTAEAFNLTLPSTNNFSYIFLDSGNNIITSTPSVLKGASFNFTVKVTIPAGTPTGTEK